VSKAQVERLGITKQMPERLKSDIRIAQAQIEASRAELMSKLKESVTLVQRPRSKGRRDDIPH
jgi:hypothetical protein